MNDMGELNRCTGHIVDAAIRVHRALGPGLLESAYEACLGFELERRGFRVEGQKPMPIDYFGSRLDVGYRADLIVNDAVIVELKAVAKLQPIHAAQLLSYLRVSGYRLGLLFNFHELRLRNGIKRLVNDRLG